MGNGESVGSKRKSNIQVKQLKSGIYGIKKSVEKAGDGEGEKDSDRE